MKDENLKLKNIIKIKMKFHSFIPGNEQPESFTRAIFHPR